jgi:hypothetical protein
MCETKQLHILQTKPRLKNARICCKCKYKIWTIIAIIIFYFLESNTIFEKSRKDQSKGFSFLRVFFVFREYLNEFELHTHKLPGNIFCVFLVKFLFCFRHEIKSKSFSAESFFCQKTFYRKFWNHLFRILNSTPVKNEIIKWHMNHQVQGTIT